MIISLGETFLLVRIRPSFLVIAQAHERFSLCLETDSGEYCQTVEPYDLIIVSAPEGGEPEAGVMLIELVRRYQTPLIVLQKDHPGSRRLRYVVSVGPSITTNCSIRRGTHPEQHLICASQTLSGIALYGVEEGVRIDNLPSRAELIHFLSRIKTEYYKNNT